MCCLAHEGDGGGRYKATYNATKAGNYSLEVKDADDGEHAVGSPFTLLVEPNQAFAPATLVWWDRQVSGSPASPHLPAIRHALPPPNVGLFTGADRR